MIRSQPPQPMMEGLDLTPLIDIIFIMLVFLMLSANPVTTLLSMELPEDHQSQAAVMPPPNPVHLALSPDAPHWHLDKTPYTSLDALRQALLNEPNLSQRPILVAGDKTVPLEPVLQLFSLLQAEGLTQVQFVMEPAQ
ncbi:ExbD/TolR family protein [Ferrimonas balearica]|uniref:ExbD/TolR family protein n=1 Tax=Ferrimonas balearica TaxID=44012 RepID=UPI001C596B88|nr:biopolymer transporter ExbD [Ferrimonas balearica]MBW3164103.1 biopolymer transporter ExbD [Ferrimonas balearica]